MKKQTIEAMEAVFTAQNVSANMKPKSIRYVVGQVVEALNLTTEKQIRDLVMFIRRNREWSTTANHADLVTFFKGVKTVVGVDARLCAPAFEQFTAKKATFTHPDEATEKAV